MKHVWRFVVLAVVFIKISVYNLKISLQKQQGINEFVLSMYSWSGVFPEDPFEGEGPGRKSRKVRNVYEYIVNGIAFELDGERFFYVSKTPTTIVICSGTGQIPCVSGNYQGDINSVIMSEKELKDVGVEI